jgi:hypothetical protein
MDKSFIVKRPRPRGGGDSLDFAHRAEVPGDSEDCGCCSAVPTFRSGRSQRANEQPRIRRGADQDRHCVDRRSCAAQNPYWQARHALHTPRSASRDRCRGLGVVATGAQAARDVAMAPLADKYYVAECAGETRDEVT